MTDANHFEINQLTRRDFLRLCGASSIGLALAACGVAPTPTSTPTLTPTPVPTNTPLPTNTQLPTATATLTNTPAPTNTSTPTGTPTATATPRPPTLRDYAAPLGIDIGSQIVWYRLNDRQYTDVASREFNLALSAGEISWKDARPSRTQFNFNHADMLVDFAQQNKMRLSAYHLAYSGEDIYQQWLSQGDFSRDDYISILKEHINTVVGRYKGKINLYTVVNEVFDWNRFKGFWFEKIGPDFIEMAFRWARESDPDAILIYNDVNVSGGAADGHEDAVLRLFQDLRAKDVPIDGIGMQMHIDGDKPAKKRDVIANFQRFASAGARIYVTEFDVNLKNVGGTQQERYQKQAQIYKDMFEAALESGCKSFCLFGFNDRDSWLKQTSAGGRYSPISDGTPFDNNFQPKPAYFAMLQVLQEYYAKQKPK
jgi:endo-1,4-beta-xylanase